MGLLPRLRRIIWCSNQDCRHGSQPQSRALPRLCCDPLAGLATYEAARHFADARAVTRLSAYVHHGQLSARLLMAETHKAGGKALSKTFSRRLIWRDLAYWQLALWPDMACQPMRPHYAAQVWGYIHLTLRHISGCLGFDWRKLCDLTMPMSGITHLLCAIAGCCS